uniref:Uncharacterized protein n=1 Tax=Glossina austeni TaxID=7395 RepID=A0A1A9VBT6_GLOAU
MNPIFMREQSKRHHFECQLVRYQEFAIWKRDFTLGPVPSRLRFHYLYLCHNGSRIDPRAMHRSGNRKPSGQLFKHLPSWAKRPERHVMHCDSAEPLQVAQDE